MIAWRFPRAMLLMLLGLALQFCVLPPARGELANEKLQQLIDDQWEFQLKESPLFATNVGDHRANDQLDSVRLADIERRASKNDGFIKRLSQIDRDALSGADRVNYAVLKRSLEDSASEHRFKSYLVPISNRSGFHISFPELRREVPLVTTEDFDNYIARLSAFGDYADQHIAVLREGVRQGYTQPSVIMEGAEESIEAHIVKDPTTSLLYEPLKAMPATVPESQHDRLRSEARAAIAQSIVPGYQRFLEFITEEYMPNCRGTVAARALPDGREFYRHRVRKFTTLDDATPEAVHQRGLGEVKRIREEMDAIIEKVDFEGDFPAFVEHLRDDPKFYAETPEELLAACSYILKRADGELPKLFGRLPRMPYGVRPVPDYIAPKTTAAYYQSPAGDGTRAGFYYLNTYDLASRPMYMLQALSLHEAVPGHHLQLALQQELEGMPEFRKFGGFTAFVEGWALYSERLGLEIGFYEDPYSDFGRLSMEIWRACRLVVDTGIHYLGWTREEAIEYMRENSALSLHNIRSEVDRYIGWPGQALAYKTGELRIRELRAMAEEELAEKFDVRAFHDVVLGSGAVPLDVLEENVQAWVTRVKAG